MSVDRVAKNIRLAMLEQGVRSRDMARLLGITERAWRHLMQDPENRLTIGRLTVIARRLGVASSQLIGENRYGKEIAGSKD